MHLGRTAVFGSKLAAWIHLWSFCLHMRKKRDQTTQWIQFEKELKKSRTSMGLRQSWTNEFEALKNHSWRVYGIPDWKGM